MPAEQSPMQQNGYDCGVWVMSYAQLLVNFSSSDGGKQANACMQKLVSFASFHSRPDCSLPRLCIPVVQGTVNELAHLNSKQCVCCRSSYAEPCLCDPDEGVYTQPALQLLSGAVKATRAPPHTAGSASAPPCALDTLMALGCALRCG